VTDPDNNPDKKPERKPVATSRVVIWIVVAGIAVYYIAKGLISVTGN
jgi:hypothetical protein